MRRREIMSTRFKLLSFVLAFLLGLAFNEANLYSIRVQNPANTRFAATSLVHGATVFSIDNEWYLQQVPNLLRGHGYIQFVGRESSRVSRSPGYPFFYGAHYALFGERNSFFVIRYVQLLLHALSVVLLGMAAFNITGDARTGRWATILYLLCPVVFVYAYFTLTESISPALVIVAFYALSRTYTSSEHSRSLGRYALVGLALGILALTRPLAGVLLPIFLLSIFVRRDQPGAEPGAEPGTTPAGAKPERSSRTSWRLRAAGAIIAAFALVLSPWTIRNYIVTGGQFIPLEKDNHNSTDLYPQGHIELRRWMECWSNPGDVLFTYKLAQLGSAPGPRATSQKAVAQEIERFIAALPPVALSGTSRAELSDVLTQYARYSVFMYGPKYLVHTQPRSAEVNALEDAVARRLRSLTASFKSRQPLRYYFITPLQRMKEFIFASNSATFTVLDLIGARSHALQSVIKAVLYLVNVALFANLILLLASRKHTLDLKILLAAPALFVLFFFAFVHRYVEIRYTLSFFPLLFCALACTLARLAPLGRASRSRRVAPAIARA